MKDPAVERNMTRMNSLMTKSGGWKVKDLCVKASYGAVVDRLLLTGLDSTLFFH